MWWAIFKYVGVMIVAVVCVLVFSSNTHAWPVGSQPEYRIVGTKISSPYPCSGKFMQIAVSGQGSIEACVMGEKTRVASYVAAQGGVMYAISFPFDAAFYVLDVCRGSLGCMYAEESDTFVGRLALYNNFAGNLTKSTYSGSISYGLSAQSPIFATTQYGTLSLAGETIATSKNGKWALLEIKSYGIIRVNIQTHEMRRIIAPGVEYGYGFDPHMELAISNDGNTVAVVGANMGVWVVVVDETCGDRPGAFMQTHYMGAVTGCRYLNTPTSSYGPGFAYATRPIFSDDDKSLSFDVASHLLPSRRVTLFSDNGDSEREMYYVAIGDSFTSGEGEVNDAFYLGGASNRCHVSARSYPFLLARAWNVPAYSTACSGATIDSARSPGAGTNRPNQLSELESHPSQVVTVGIGGNDAGLIGKLKTCLGLGTCEWAKEAKQRQSTALEIKNLYPRLKKFYEDVKIRAYGPVIAVGYPRIISSQPHCESPIGVLLDETERTFMNEAIHYLNRVIKAAANDVEIEYGDAEDAFSGGELCTSFTSPFMNAIRVGDEFPDITALPFVKVIGAESFHPTPEGHGRVADKILQTFASVDAMEYCITCGGLLGAPTPSSYWNGPDSTPKVQQAIPFLKKVTIKKGDSFEISFPAFSFQPSSDVVLELHSDVKNLGTVQSAEDGSLSTTISMSDTDLGFHTVHAIGKSYAGSDIDVYDFLAVEDDGVVSNPAVVDTTTTTSISGQDSKQASKTSATSLIKNGPPHESGVLGDSIVAIVNTVPSNSDKSSVTPGSRQLSAVRYVWMLALGAGAVLAIIGGSLYVYYRQKHPRN